MPSDRDVWLEGLRLPDSAARRLLERAGELDGPRSGIPVSELRQAATEAGISTQAFDAALGELWLDVVAAGATPATTRPGSPVARRSAAEPAGEPRRRRFAWLARAIALVGVGALAGGLVARATAPTPGPTIVMGPPGAPAPIPKVAVPPGAGGRTYFEFQVEKPVEPVNPVAPVYPAELQARGVSGQVIAQFVVDETGRVDVATFKVIESTHALFTSAVEATLPLMHFAPAEIGGRAVRQLVQQPFVFNIGR